MSRPHPAAGGTDVNVISVGGTSVTGPADLKASGFSTHAAADVVSAMQLVASDFMADVSSLSTSAEITALEAHGDTNWITATGFSTFDPDTDTVDVSAINGTPRHRPGRPKASGFSTHAAADVVSAMQVVAADFKADVSGLAVASDQTDIKTIAEKLDTAIEIDGAVYRLTANALEQAPSGGGGTDVNVISVGGTSVTGPADLKASGFSTHAAADVVSAMQVVAADFMADVSGLAGASDQTDIKAITDKLDTAIELDGVVYRLTANALEEAPTAGSLDADVVAGCTEALNAYDPPTRSEATSDKNEILASVGGGVSGARTIEFTTVDSVGNPIPDVYIGVYNNDGTVLLTAGSTGPSGSLSVALDDASYSVTLRKGGYSFTVPESITVISDDAFTFSAEELTISLPVSVSDCRVYEWIYHPGDTIPSNIEATARIIRLPFDYSGRLYTGRSFRSRIDSSGFIFWDLPKGSTVHFTIHEAGVSRTATIPDSSSSRLTDI